MTREENFKDLSFNQRRLELRSYWKKLKVGFIQWNEIPPNFQTLIMTYYPVYQYI